MQPAKWRWQPMWLYTSRAPPDGKPSKEAWLSLLSKERKKHKLRDQKYLWWRKEKVRGKESCEKSSTLTL